MKIFNNSGKFLLDLKNHSVQNERDKIKLADANLREKDLKNLTFDGLLFEGGDFDSADARGMNIRRSDFEGTWLCDINLSGSKIEEVEFYDVAAYQAKFIDSKISSSKFFGVNLSGADFRNAKLDGVVFMLDRVNHKTDLSGADFTNVDLSKVSFEGALYNAETKFPAGFNPSRHKGLEIETE